MELGTHTRPYTPHPSGRRGYFLHIRVNSKILANKVAKHTHEHDSVEDTNLPLLEHAHSTDLGITRAGFHTRPSSRSASPWSAHDVQPQQPLPRRETHHTLTRTLTSSPTREKLVSASTEGMRHTMLPVQAAPAASTGSPAGTYSRYSLASIADARCRHKNRASAACQTPHHVESACDPQQQPSTTFGERQETDILYFTHQLPLLLASDPASPSRCTLCSTHANSENDNATSTEDTRSPNAEGYAAAVQLTCRNTLSSFRDVHLQARGSDCLPVRLAHPIFPPSPVPTVLRGTHTAKRTVHGSTPCAGHYPLCHRVRVLRSSTERHSRPKTDRNSYHGRRETRAKSDQRRPHHGDVSHGFSALGEAS